MPYIVVLNPNSNPWKVVDESFNSCPPSPVHYSNLRLQNPLPVLAQCDRVTVIHSATGAQQLATPIKIS